MYLVKYVVAKLAEKHCLVEVGNVDLTHHECIGLQIQKWRVGGGAKVLECAARDINSTSVYLHQWVRCVVIGVIADATVGFNIEIRARDVQQRAGDVQQ